MVKVIVNRGRCAAGLLRYVFDPKKQLQPLGGDLDWAAVTTYVSATNMVGQTVAELTREFEFMGYLNSRVQRLMCHYSVSMAPSEVLDQALINGLARALLKHLGHDGIFLAVRHYDQEYRNNVQHFHVVTSTINFDGSWVSDSFDRFRLKPVERILEKSFGLYSPEPSSNNQVYLSTGEYRRKLRTGEILPKEKLWDLIRAAAADQPSFPVLVTRLIAHDVTVRFRVDSSSIGDPPKILGISFGFDGAFFRGSGLGKCFSLVGLQRDFGVSLLEHDIPGLLNLQFASQDFCVELLRQQILASVYATGFER